MMDYSTPWQTELYIIDKKYIYLQIYLQNAFLFATIVEKARYRPKTSKGGERAIWAF